MFSFLPLTNDSVTTGLSVLLPSILATALSKAINILRSLFGFYFSKFLEISFVSFEYSIKVLESLKSFKPVLLRLPIYN